MLLRIDDIISTPTIIYPTKLAFSLIRYFDALFRKFKFHSNLSLITGSLIKRTHIRIEKQYVNVLGITAILEKEGEVEDASSLLIEVRKVLKSMRETYTLLESVTVLKNTPFMQTFDKLLDAMYDMEFIVRKKACHNNKPIGTSAEAEITARLQLQALHSL